MPSKVPVLRWVPHMFMTDMRRIDGEHGDPGAGDWPSKARRMPCYRQVGKKRYALLSATPGPEVSHSAAGSLQLVCIYGPRELELVSEPQGWLHLSVQGELWFGGNRTELHLNCGHRRPDLRRSAQPESGKAGWGLRASQVVGRGN